MRALHCLRRSTSRRPLPLSRPFHTSPLLHKSIPATFARGGTSNGLVILREHLPPQLEWHTVLPRVMGSPDAYGRQLDGIGSGISSTSKVCVVSRSERGDADVDFTFVQVGVGDGGLDVAGNCGNMSAVVGPVGFEEGYGGVVEGGEAVVRIYNTNTGKIVHSRFELDGEGRFEPRGEYEMTGVPGTGSRITLSFLRPGGAGTGRGVLPTGKVVDELVMPGGQKIEASLVDVSNPGVFVSGSDLKLGKDIMPGEVESDAALKEVLEGIRRAGAVKMGLDPEVGSVPKVVVVFGPREGEEEDVRCLAMSMGQAHKAVPLTLALCLGAAAGVKGTIPWLLRRTRADGKKGKEVGSETVVIGHPSGTVEIGTTVEDGDVISAELHRTARVLMKGEVFY